MKNQNPNKRDITLTEDLIDEWVKETGKPKELLEEMLKLHYKYLDHIIDNEEKAIIINFPWLGKLRFNYLLGRQYTKKMPNSIGMKAKFDRLYDIMLKEGNKVVNFNMPMIGKQYYQMACEYPSKMYIEFYKYVTIVEKENNKWYKENYEN